jgi:ATP-binding protein involved in chromosome partitioning
MSKDTQEAVMEALGHVMDPELHSDLVTLNMIHDLSIEGGKANFTIRLTTPACPLKDEIGQAARTAVLAVDGIHEVTINWDSQIPGDSRIKDKIDVPLRNIIAVSSGKGGVGKTTVSVNLALALAETGASVGILDADILCPNVPTMLGLPSRPPATVGEGDDRKIIPFEAFGVHVMSMGFLVGQGQPLIWRGPMLHGAIRQLFEDVQWPEIDYMFVDLPPGTGDAQLSLAQSVPLTGAIIVTQPQRVALGDALRGLAMFEEMNVPILGIVENMSGELFGRGGAEALAQQTGVPYLGSIPQDSKVRVAGDEGKPVVVSAPESEAAAAIKGLSCTIAARISVLTTKRNDLDFEHMQKLKVKQG